MRTEASVDLLRKTLIRHGHVLPTVHQDSKCIILNQGEYLVSLLSHDGSLLQLLNDMDYLQYDSYWNTMVHGDAEEGYLFNGHYRVDFDLWVDTVKFVWILHGVTAALELIKGPGFDGWSSQSLARRHRYVDDLVLLAQKKLRQSGARYSEMAEFFADAEAAKATSVKH
jgi:hypothetical protein